MKNVFLIFATFVLSAISFADSKPPETVANLDLSKYLGVWYEIASFPAPHQDDCVATKATYSLRKDGDIEIANECRDKTLTGKLRSASGKAWVVDKATPAKLKVRFVWPFSSDYWVIEIGEKYECAVVSGPARKYLWILSRTRQLPKNVLDGILGRLKDNGFDLGRLNHTLQPES